MGIFDLNAFENEQNDFEQKNQFRNDDGRYQIFSMLIQIRIVKVYIDLKLPWLVIKGHCKSRNWWCGLLRPNFQRETTQKNGPVKKIKKWCSSWMKISLSMKLGIKPIFDKTFDWTVSRNIYSSIFRCILQLFVLSSILIADKSNTRAGSSNSCGDR